MENIFRSERKSIQEYFVINYVADDTAVENYIRVSLPQKWQGGKSPSLNKIDEPDYEETLINYFKSNDPKNVKPPILIIVGGVGTGKSSSVRYAIHNSDICHNCYFSQDCPKDYPERIIVDFISFKTSVIAEGPNPQNLDSELEKFWLHITHILDKAIDQEVTFDVIVSFWKWLLVYEIRAIPVPLYRLLYPKRDLLENPQINSGELRKLQELIFERLDIEGIAKYKLFQIAYLRRENHANCNFVIFDNIDTLAPFLQAKVIEFTLEANRLINCKAVIPVRPNTFKTNIDASDFYEVMDHWKPSLEKVFYKRLENYENKGNPEVALRIKEVIELIKRNKIFSTVFVASSGLSTRFALRNFYNFLLSPFVVTHKGGQAIPINLDTNTFFQAYFCNEAHEQELDEGSFQNLLAIVEPDDYRNLSSLKIRILYIISLRGSINLEKLMRLLSSFGYEKFEIVSAINEFLEAKRALLWGSSLDKYTVRDLEEGGRHILHLTHLGRRYYSTLLSQPMYLRECATAISDQERVRFKDESIRMVIDSLSKIRELDFDEVATFCLNSGKKRYEQLFPSTGPLSISELIWQKVKQNLSGWVGDSKITGYDPHLDEYIRKRMENHLDQFES